MHSTTVKVRVRTDNHNILHDTKAIVVRDGILMSHLKYLIQSQLRGRRGGWVTKSIQAIRLLIDYSIVNEGVFQNPFELFQAFSERIYGGTIDDEGFDPTDLRWTPSTVNRGNEVIHHVTSFSDWLNDQTDGASELLNPKRTATQAERIVNLAAYNHRMNNAFLKHIYAASHKAQSVNQVRMTQKRQRLAVQYDPQKPFPEDRIWDLIGVGFARKGLSPNAPIEKKYNLANILITMLMHFGGCRVSEVFHLFVDDIIPNDGFQQIRVYHPIEGLAPHWYRDKTTQPYCNRILFLQQKYGLKDRLTTSTNNSTYHVGWKNPVVSSNGKYFPVFLFGNIGDKGVSDLFYRFFRIYITTVRKPPVIGREHPFLFTNKNGDPLSMDSFVSAHEIAVRKIGMSPYLESGGSRHSHRHSYGQRLADSNIDELTIKAAMHHRSLESQKTYTEPHTKKIAAGLAKAQLLTSSSINENASTLLNDIK